MHPCCFDSCLSASLQAFTPIITMIALFMTALEVPTQQLISSVMLIAVGTAIASYGEVNFNIIGVACMFASESFEATRLVMTQIVLVGLKFNAGVICLLTTLCSTSMCPLLMLWQY